MAKKRAKKAKKAGRRSSNREVLVVGSKVKNYIRSKGAKTSGELIGALSDQLYSMIDSAIARAEGNKRSTVQPRDL